PGPEVYVVGDLFPTPIVNTSTFTSDPNHGCGRSTCYSDFILYDLDGDGRPNGPISRIPARTAADANRAEHFAHEFTNDMNVDMTHRLLEMSGDMATGATSPSGWPDDALASVTTDFQAVGYTLKPVLRESEIPDPNGRVSSFVTSLNQGARELFGIGGDTGLNHLPG